MAVTDPLLLGFRPNLVPATFPLANTAIDFAGVEQLFPPNSDEFDNNLFNLLGMEDDGTFDNGVSFDFSHGGLFPGTAVELPDATSAVSGSMLVPASLPVPVPVSDIDAAGATGGTPSGNPLPSGPIPRPELLHNPVPELPAAHLPTTAAMGVTLETPAPMLESADPFTMNLDSERPRRTRKAPSRYENGTEPVSKRAKPSKAAEDITEDAPVGRATHGMGAGRGGAKRGAGRGGAKPGATKGACGGTSSATDAAGTGCATKAGGGRGAAKAGKAQGSAKGAAGRGHAKTMTG